MPAMVIVEDILQALSTVGQTWRHQDCSKLPAPSLLPTMRLRLISIGLGFKLCSQLVSGQQHPNAGFANFIRTLCDVAVAVGSQFAWFTEKHERKDLHICASKMVTVAEGFVSQLVLSGTRWDVIPSLQQFISQLEGSSTTQPQPATSEAPSTKAKVQGGPGRWCCCLMVSVFQKAAPAESATISQVLHKLATQKPTQVAASTSSTGRKSSKKSKEATKGNKTKSTEQASDSQSSGPQPVPKEIYSALLDDLDANKRHQRFVSCPVEQLSSPS